MRVKYSLLLPIVAAIFLFNILLINQAYGAQQSCVVPSAPQLAGISNGNDVYLALDCLSGNELYDVLYGLTPELPPAPPAPVGPAAPGLAQPQGKPPAPPAPPKPPAGKPQPVPPPTPQAPIQPPAPPVPITRNTLYNSL